MIITDKVEIKWNGRNRIHFETKGYKPYAHNQPFIVPVIDLMETSPIKVEVKCDVCGDISLKKYNQYIVARSEVPFDVCKKGNCQNIKREKVFQYRYGVNNSQELENTREKREITNLERFGYVNPMQNEEIKNKITQTNLKKYGVKYHTQSDEWKKKIKTLSLNKYGLNHHSQLKEIRDKIANTNLKKYGFKHVMSNPEIKAKAIESKYKNGNQMTSRQQRLICELTSGELNYPYYGASLDVVLPNEKIYIEYDGGGHWLSVKLGSETIEEFNNRNNRRWYSLNRNGWKEIRITSLKDKLPFDDVLIEMINFAKEELNNRSWIHFNIDEGFVETSKYKKAYNYGILRGTYTINN